MIPFDKLLPPLSAKDRIEFEKLNSDYNTAKAQVSAHNSEARVARKKELQAMRKTAPADQLLGIGAELETLEGAYSHARRGAKEQLRTLGRRYPALFSRLFDQCDAHADKLIAQAGKTWAAHFETIGVIPFGVDPVVDALLSWKATIKEKRWSLELYVTRNATPSPPNTILPYPINASASAVLQ